MTVNIAHCFFEQSGTFKNAFRRLGIPAFDYDIYNQFGHTDFLIDLFSDHILGIDSGHTQPLLFNF